MRADTVGTRPPPNEPGFLRSARALGREGRLGAARLTRTEGTDKAGPGPLNVRDREGSR
jgi:hypothetical protein